MNNIKNVTDASFSAEVLQSETPVLVDFWAPWCGPCRMIAPVLENIADKFDGRLTIAKMNTDENQNTAASYGIMAIPTLIIFKDGKEADRIIGVEPQERLEERLAKAVSFNDKESAGESA